MTRRPARAILSTLAPIETGVRYSLQIKRLIDKRVALLVPARDAMRDKSALSRLSQDCADLRARGKRRRWKERAEWGAKNYYIETRRDET